MTSYPHLNHQRVPSHHDTCAVNYLHPVTFPVVEAMRVEGTPSLAWLPRRWRIYGWPFCRREWPSWPFRWWAQFVWLKHLSSFKTYIIGVGHIQHEGITCICIHIMLLGTDVLHLQRLCQNNYFYTIQSAWWSFYISNSNIVMLLKTQSNSMPSFIPPFATSPWKQTNKSNKSKWINSELKCTSYVHKHLLFVQSPRAVISNILVMINGKRPNDTQNPRELTPRGRQSHGGHCDKMAAIVTTV